MNFSYRISRAGLRVLYGGLCRWDVNGVENVPETGGLIVVANHVSLNDPPVLGAALPRKINYMAKKELFDNFFLDKLLKKFGAFPVKRGRGDMGAIKKALKTVRQEKVLGLFPEGTRSQTGKLKRAKSGIVLIATKAQVPILPVGLKGTKKPFRKDLEVNFGEAFTLDEYYNRKLDKKELKAAGKIIMEQIEKQLK